MSLQQPAKYPKSTWKHWRSYEDLELVKQLSLLLECSTEPTIHITLDYFLRLLNEVLEASPKIRIVACVVFNAFVDTF